MTWPMHDGERHWISQVVADLADDDLKLVYADWLEERGDERAAFLRAFVGASHSMARGDFPKPTGLPEEWLELIGFRLLERAAAKEFPELKGPMLRLARPALRMVKAKAADRDIPIGASKVGGLPDLPPGFRWPPGGECRAIYNDDTGGTDRLAGFLAQVNLAEIADTQAARELPRAGLVSFFCFQDMENDNPDAIGAYATFFPDTAGLVRAEPPARLTEGNECLPSSRLGFEETLDLPSTSDGPWSDELRPDPKTVYGKVLDHFRERNFWNVLGYARSTSGGDPTESKDSRHLILLETSAGCRLHIHLNQADLTAGSFGAIALKWVDFD